MEKFDITEAYVARADALAGKAPKSHEEEDKRTDEKIRRNKK